MSLAKADWASLPEDPKDALVGYTPPPKDVRGSASTTSKSSTLRGADGGATLTGSHTGGILRVPSKDYPTIEEAVMRAKDGDCVFLEPIVFTFTETLLIDKSIHMIGVDEVGACAVIRMNGGALKPALPALRISAQKVHLKGLRIEFSHDTKTAPVDAVLSAYAIFVSEGGTAVLDEVNIKSSCGGIRGGPVQLFASGKGRDLPSPSSTYVTAVCCKFECDTVAVAVEGKSFLDRCSISVGARGVLVHDGAYAKVEGCGFVGGGLGVDVQRRGTASVERNAFVDVAIGVNVYNNGISIPQPVVVRGNEFRNPMEAAVKADGEGAVIEVSKNLVHGFTSSTSAGFEIANGKSEIKSNVVKDCLGSSILLSGGSPLVESNVLEVGKVGVAVRNSRPTIRLNEICFQQVAGVLVEGGSMHQPGQQRQGRNTSTAAADTTLIHPQQEADPHVEANTFHDCYTNLKVSSVTGTFLKNDFAVTQHDNVLLDGPVVVPIVLSGNAIGGSKEGCCVLATNGTEAHITDNEIFGAKVSCVMLKGCGFCEVKSNDIHSAQTAIIAMQRAVGKVAENSIEGDMPVDVYTDSQSTVTLVKM